MSSEIKLKYQKFLIRKNYSEFLETCTEEEQEEFINAVIESQKNQHNEKD